MWVAAFNQLKAWVEQKANYLPNKMEFLMPVFEQGHWAFSCFEKWTETSDLLGLEPADLSLDWNYFIGSSF